MYLSFPEGANWIPVINYMQNFCSWPYFVYVCKYKIRLLDLVY